MIAIAVLTAAASIWLVNRQAVGLLGNKAIVAAVPFIEELIKTSTAVLFQVPLIALHGLFGILEALFDLLHGGLILPAVSGCLGHWLFGFTTGILIKRLGFWPAWFFASLVHVSWNAFVVRCIAVRLDKNLFVKRRRHER